MLKQRLIFSFPRRQARYTVFAPACKVICYQQYTSTQFFLIDNGILQWCAKGGDINFNAFYYKKFKYGAINYRIWVICG